MFREFSSLHFFRIFKESGACDARQNAMEKVAVNKELRLRYLLDDTDKRLISWIPHQTLFNLSRFFRNDFD